MLRWFASPASLMTALLLLAFACPASAQRNTAATPVNSKIGVQEAYDRAVRDELQIVDIRRPSEWRQTGIAAGAIPVTMHQPFPNFLARMKALSAENSGKPIAIICAAGVRTSRMQRVLARHGVRVVNITPGMTGNWLERGWVQTGLPVKRGQN